MLLFLSALCAHAAPLQIDHSTRILDSDGAAINGPITLTTRLFDADTAGSQLWTGSTTTQASDGYVNVTLSGGTPSLDSSVFDHPQVWLEVQVGGGAPLSPRKRLSSVPYALAAEHAASADVAATVVLDTSDGTGSCQDGAMGLNPTTRVFRVCSDSSWVDIAVEDTAVGTSANPAASCQDVLDNDPSAADATYIIDPDGAGTHAPIPMYCDMLGTEGWALTYVMCQNSTGSIQNINHELPVTPLSSPNPASIPYATVFSMNPRRVRFTSDFNSGMGYLFNWSTAIGGVNHMQTLLQGSMDNPNVCVSMGPPLAGSTGQTCSMSWQHNNSGSEAHDIPTLGCPCSVWSTGGMQWGQIDGLGNYNGVSHVLTSSWSHTPQTTNGCIQAYVK